jgi:chromosome segregation ATPase
LQTSAASMVRSIAMERATLPDATRQELLAFLSGGQGEGYAPASGKIVGILKTMGDEMTQNLKDSTETETGAITNYEALMAAKKKEVDTLQKQIETEMERIGRLGMEVAEVGNDLEDTKEALAADEKFKAELASSCSTKGAEGELIKKTRPEELLALAETVKVLNDYSALDLFLRRPRRARAPASYS